MESLGTGLNFTCAISLTGYLACWGNNSNGQTTFPTNYTSYIQSVNAGGSHTCAITLTGSLFC